jgi:hypothetical protein
MSLKTFNLIFMSLVIGAYLLLLLLWGEEAKP